MLLPKRVKFRKHEYFHLKVLFEFLAYYYLHP